MRTKVSRSSKILLVVTGTLALIAVWTVIDRTPQMDQSLAAPPQVWAGDPPSDEQIGGVYGFAVDIVLGADESEVGPRDPVRFTAVTRGAADKKALLLRLRPGAAPSGRPDEDAQRLLDWIRGQGLMGRARVLAYDWALLEALAKLSPEIGLAFGTLEAKVDRRDGVASPWLAGRELAEVEGSLPALVKQAGGSLWAPTLRELRPEEMKEAESLGLQVMVTEVDDPSVFPSLLLMRPEAIVTDHPAQLLSDIKARPGLFAFGAALE